MGVYLTSGPRVALTDRGPRVRGSDHAVGAAPCGCLHARYCVGQPMKGPGSTVSRRGRRISSMPHSGTLRAVQIALAVQWASLDLMVSHRCTLRIANIILPFLSCQSERALRSISMLSAGGTTGIGQRTHSD